MAQNIVSRPTLPVLAGDTGLAQYMQQIRQFPLLEAGEEYMLAKRYSEHQDHQAARKLVTSHLRLVAKIALGYRGYGMPINEMIAEGNIGLMQAVRKFDPERGFRLSTYAMWWIRAAIQEYILRSWSLVKLGTTAAQKKLFFNLRRIKNKIGLLSDKSIPPDKAKEIAETLDVNTKEVHDMNARLGRDASLNAPVKEGEDTSEWQDWLEDERPNQEVALTQSDDAKRHQALITDGLKQLGERERAVLKARRLSEPPVTLARLSAQYNVSRERIRQIEVQAFQKLSQHIQKQAQTDTTST